MAKDLPQQRLAHHVQVDEVHGPPDRDRERRDERGLLRGRQRPPRSHSEIEIAIAPVCGRGERSEHDRLSDLRLRR